MRKKLFIIFLMCFGLIVLFPPSPKNTPLTSVFRLTDKPITITHGTYGSALTVNISFGNEEIGQWIQELEKPYPFLFIDMDWAGRYPEIIRLINEKNIPTGLLGNEGTAYEKDATILLNQLEQYEDFFSMKPLWFRTADEVFPFFLRSLLVEVEVNALSSSFKWQGGHIPPMTEGEIISVSHQRDDRVSLIELNKLFESRDFHSIEDVIFGLSVKTKKIPK